MYETHFGLRDKPFSLIPDPQFLYLSRGHRLALTLLEYGVTEQSGFIVVTGEVGSGKTTLVRRLLSIVGDDVNVGLITNTHESFGELMRWILLAYGIEQRSEDRVECYRSFVDFLVDQYSNNKRTVLIVDEAQNLSSEALEELRMLSNVNAERYFLLQLILIGQPELRDKLRSPALRQFVQRISIHYHLDALALEDTVGYIRHRLSVAGGNPGLLDDLACAAVHHYTFGVPRLINVLCDLALVYAYAEDKPFVDTDLVLDVVAARQGTGLEVFRNDPEITSRREVKLMLSQLLNGDADQSRLVSGAAG